MIWLSLIKRFWWAIPLAILLGALSISRMEVRHLRTANADLIATIARYERISAENVQKAVHDKETADAALASSSKAAAILGADLSSRVRDYENRLRSGAVQGPAEPVQAIGSSPPATEPRPDVDGAIAAALGACARDADRLDNAYQWASGLGNGPAAPRP